MTSGSLGHCLHGAVFLGGVVEELGAGLVALLERVDLALEDLADLFGQLRVAISIFLERGALAAPDPSREFLS